MTDSQQPSLSIEKLREWFSDSAVLHVLSRGHTRRGFSIIDVKRRCASGELLNIGGHVAHALGRPFDHDRGGIHIHAAQLPSVFTQDLSMALYGSADKVRIEWI